MKKIDKNIVNKNLLSTLLVINIYLYNFNRHNCLDDFWPQLI